MSRDALAGNVGTIESTKSCVYCITKPIISFGTKLAIDTVVPCREHDDVDVNQKVMTPGWTTKIIETE